MSRVASPAAFNTVCYLYVDRPGNERGDIPRSAGREKGSGARWKM